MSSPRRTRTPTPRKQDDANISSPALSRRGTPARGSRTPRSTDENTSEQTASTVQANGTPAKRSTRGTPAKSSQNGTPARSETGGSTRSTPARPTRSAAKGTPKSKGSHAESVPTPRRWGAQAQAREQQNVILDSSEPQSNINPTSPLPTGYSEIDLSSPINYGTPSSNLSSVRTPRSGIRGTPIRLRPDIRTDKRIRQVQIDSDAVADEAGNNAPQLVIWGTDVVVNVCKDKFKKFVLEFVDPDAEEDERIDKMDVNQPLYLQKLEEIRAVEEPFMNVNCAHLEKFDEELYRQLVCYPQEVIPTLDMAINEMFFEYHPAAVLDHQIQVRPFNAHKTKNMRSLNPEDIDQLITISGMVTRTSNIIPEMREAFFKCVVCAFSCSVEMDRGRIAEPTLCTNCNTNHCFQLVHNRSQFADKQTVKLQESPDDMPAGQTPHTVMLNVHNDMVDTVQAGDRVTVTGVYRAVPMQVNPRMRNVRAVYKTHIDVVHFRKVDSKRLYETEEGKDHRFPPERVEVLKQLSQKDDIYDRMARAIAPSIYENEDIKKGILLQLLSGTKKSFTDSGRGHFRAEINILLCGDPGTSKSQLLQYVYNLVPRSQYTSGKGSSAVGLTAFVTKDPETRQLVLQTGALVLADNGVCCIDEFDKMNDSTRSVLHEVMEQQTLSIAKAGIICQLNARTSILAAANPAESQWNKNKTIIENIMLPHTLMSRFDLIFLMLDPQNELFDRRLARHLVSLYYKTREAEEDALMDMSILRDYIAYAREHVHPKLSTLAGTKLIDAYVEMRKLGSGRGQITAYPRQLESLIRMSEAHAKIRFSPTVEIEDVEEAWRLHREALKQSATDPLSGKIDVGILTTGLSATARRARAELTDGLRKLVLAAKGRGAAAPLNQQKVLQQLKDASQAMITREMFEDAMKILQDDGVIIIAGRNNIRIC